MTRLSRLARLEELGRALDTAARVIEELSSTGSLARFATEDPARWNPLLDALSMTMEASEPASLAHVRSVLAAAMKE
jgi:hypothetical protein